MTDAMTHRGPDDRGTYAAAGVALGVRRLAIVDVAGGHQPVSNEDRSVWAVQNGELYNHGELRPWLEGRAHTLRSRCDTEVLPHLYEEAGDRTPERLRGKFGVAVWDARERRMLVARDRLGVKPLYWARTGDVVVFASELKSLLASGLVEADLDYEAIDAYLALGFVPAPRTPLAGVEKLLPGHRLVVEDGRVRTEPYWEYPKPQPSPLGRVDEHAAELLALLEESVRLRLMSDVPLGAMLSGGLDSSLVVALMARNMAEPVKTFTVGFAEDREHNELAAARHVARVFGTDHHELELSYRDTVDLEELVWALDEPIADLSTLGFHALSQLASRHVTVALCGQGADELFAGYRKHRAAALVSAWRKLPAGIATPAAAFVAARGPRRARRAAAALAADGPVDRLLAMSGQLTPQARLDLLRGPLAEVDGLEATRAVARRLNGVHDDPLPATLHVDAQLALPDLMLHYFDRASMAHSLEVRVPFLDHRLVEHAARLPSALKIRRGTTKYLLRHAARGLVPAEVIDRRKVGFFRRSAADWLEGESRGAMSEYLLAPQPAYAGLLDREAVSRLVSRHAERGESTQLLLSILMLEIWLSTFLPRALAGDATPARLAVAG